MKNDQSYILSCEDTEWVDTRSGYSWAVGGADRNGVWLAGQSYNGDPGDREEGHATWEEFEKFFQTEEADRKQYPYRCGLCRHPNVVKLCAKCGSHYDGEENAE